MKQKSEGHEGSIQRSGERTFQIEESTWSRTFQIEESAWSRNVVGVFKNSTKARVLELGIGVVVGGGGGWKRLRQVDDSSWIFS